MPASPARDLYVGLMSGTSMDGVDAVLTDFSGPHPAVLADFALPYPAGLREQLLALQAPGDNELDRAARLGNELADLYAAAVLGALDVAGLRAGRIAAVGCHGQTVRHAPQAGYTLQLNNPARLAEACGITVVADFRSRDIAAAGQGAPLVPAFHQAVFADADEARVVLNIGGIANLSRLVPDQPVVGFDTGPGNMLMDSWVRRHRQMEFDQDGNWAAAGSVLPDLLASLLAEPYFTQAAPKSTGRDLFDAAWLDARLSGREAPADVQATLAELTAASAADAILGCAPQAAAVYVCGGGARNRHLMHRLANRLPGVAVAATDALGVPAQQVEALAFAWLARACLRGEPGNLPTVTGATGYRILGAIYPV